MKTSTIDLTLYVLLFLLVATALSFSFDSRVPVDPVFIYEAK